VAFYQTTNMTGRHRGPKQKLHAGYRAPSLKWTGCLQSTVTTMHVIYQAPSLQQTSCFLSLSVVSRAFSALCLYSKFGHHPHPIGYPCAKFRFFCGLRC